MEIEQREEKEENVFPQDIQVIREVTNDQAYKNHSLAFCMPEED